jgi:hypothetical protein
LAVVLFVAALWLCFSGERFFRLVVGLVGFVAGALAGGGLATFFTKETSSIAVWLVSLLAGAAGAWVLVWAYYVGVFVVGLLGGVVAAGLFGRGVAMAPWTEIVFIFVVALVGGVLALRLQRTMIALSTALLGAGLAVGALLYGWGGIAMVQACSRTLLEGQSLGDREWAVLVGWSLLALGGAVVQLRRRS